MLKKGKKFFVVLLAMCMIFIAVCQVAFAEDPAADGLGAGDGQISPKMEMKALETGDAGAD